MAPTQTSRSGWKTFLRPGWVITFLLVCAFSYAAIMVLSPWQLHKDDAIVERNEQVEQAYKTDPVNYHDIFDERGAIMGEKEWFRVQLHGHFLSDKEVLLRLRPVSSGPSYQSLTPFALDSGEIILVNRGWIPTTAGAAPDLPAPPSAPMTIIANARYDEALPATAPMNDGGYQQVYGIHTEQIAELTGLDLAHDYVQLSEGDGSGLNLIPIPKLDRGNHLSYGFQWIAFGIMAPLGLGYMAFSEIRERRREKEEEAAMAANGDHPAKPTNQDTAINNAQEQDTAPTETTPTTPAAKETTTKVSASEAAQAQQNEFMRSRYGNTHPNRFRR